MGKATNKQADAGTPDKRDCSLPDWEGKLKQELKWHFFFGGGEGSEHVTKERTNGIFHNGQSKTKWILSYIASGLQNGEALRRLSRDLDES